MHAIVSDVYNSHICEIAPSKIKPRAWKNPYRRRTSPFISWTPVHDNEGIPDKPGLPDETGSAQGESGMK